MKKTQLYTAKLLALVLLCFNTAIAQNLSFKEYLAKREAERKATIAEYVRENPDVKLSKDDEQGNYLFLHHIDEYNKPVYYATRSNLGLAKSIKTDKLWKNGGLSLDLQGQSMEVNANRARLGVFEPSPCRTSHQEFGGRATTRDTPVFTTNNGGSEHATHVTGTMIASGVKPDAIGMANGAKIDCYEVNSDEFEEIYDAGDEGMLVSNHSYGPLFDNTKVNLGVYDAECELYDSIAVLNKNHLMFMACGNDRDDIGGITYDIMIGGTISKNLASIGAVEILGSGGYTGPASVKMSDFSSYGPTDDGRIKPDFCAPGVQIYSSIAADDTSYKHEDGTSMAGPGAAASMFLLQQHYKNKKGNFMRAATLKGLGIHTADECGANPGPDYAYGWGLLNLEKSIDVIDNKGGTHLIDEDTLNNNATYEFPVKTSGGMFKATICWTDRPGKPLVGASVDDRTPMLVNDLDLRVIDVATNAPVSTLPWKLDPNNPSNAATTGDNTVDNVEQILISNLPAGNYKIRVTHKGTLATGSQEFSMIVSGATSSVAVEEAFYVKNKTVKAYPNPFADVLIVEANNWKTVSIINTTGQLVAQYDGSAGQQKLQIDTKGWSSGIYTISVLTKDDTVETMSVVK